MARHALFPETVTQSEFQSSIDDKTNDNVLDEAEDDLDALLATLEGWSSQEKSEESSSKANANSTDNSSFAQEDVLLDELQAWRTQHSKKSYDEWNSEEKQEFMVSVKISKTVYYCTKFI